MRQWARLRPLASVRHRQAADEPGARPMTHFLDTQACIHETISRMSSKDVGLRIRVEKELRESFQGVVFRRRLHQFTGLAAVCA